MEKRVEIRTPFRAARIEDAPELAELVNYAGEGLPLYLWGEMAEDGERSQAGILSKGRQEFVA